MKRILDVSTQQEIHFTLRDLPMLIHGKDKSGASLFAITVAAKLHEQGMKLLVFTAFPMAKEEFLKQIYDPKDVLYLESEDAMEDAARYRTIIVQSGNTDLFLRAIAELDDIHERILFIKNIETIQKDIFGSISMYPFIVSGDIELNPTQGVFAKTEYVTKILFTPLENDVTPSLEKYQASLKKGLSEQIISIYE